jgi:hypothetical protein
MAVTSLQHRIEKTTTLGFLIDYVETLLHTKHLVTFM